MRTTISRRELEEQVATFSQRIHAAGWVANHDGNVTVRLGDGNFLATPTSVSKASVTRDSLIIVDAQGRLVSGRGKPFSELALHLTAFRQRADIRAVIHAHPPVTTGLSVAGIVPRTTLLAEPVVSLGAEIPLVPYALPKSPEWTETLKPALLDADVVVLEQHGVLAVGPDLETAFLRIELVEHLAKIQVAAHQAGRIREIPAEHLSSLLEARAKAGLGRRAREPSPSESRPGSKRSVGTVQPTVDSVGTGGEPELNRVRDMVREEVGRLLRE